MNRKLTVITCPVCGKEYLPVELFIPSSFFGSPDIIRRDSEGKIIDILGSDMDLTESYECDSCGKPFSVKATIQFTTQCEDKIDFSQDYKSRMSSRFELAEN